MKLFTCGQIREIDKLTITSEPVSSADLMERASRQLFNWITARFDRSHRLIVFAGSGNNGGDGLALARMLSEERYSAEIFHIRFTDKVSADWQINRDRLSELQNIRFNTVDSIDQFPLISENDIIVDAIFGSGLARPVEGLAAQVIAAINSSECLKIAVDMPSGLFGEDNSGNDQGCIVRADYTLSFQFPKLSFLFADNYSYTGEWHVLPIGLDRDAVQKMASPFILTERADVARLLKKRGKFDHKGIYGHGLLVAGSSGKFGAAILGAKAALRTGIGLLTCQVPGRADLIMHAGVPEAMVRKDQNDDLISDINHTDIFSAVATGPGLGTDRETSNALYRFFHDYRKAMVVDADALNILSQNEDWFTFLHQDMILTPHPREFERLAGSSANGYMRLEKQMEFSRKHRCIIVLKGAYTSVTMPDGRVFFNTTGNPGMATAGSGDVLTGILLSLLAQGYPAEDAAITGVYLHGLAGDIAAEESCMESIIGSDIINCIGKAFNRIRESEL